MRATLSFRLFGFDVGVRPGFWLVGFVDGNERVAFMAAYVFLGLNGHDLDAPEPEVVLVVRGLAAAKIGEDELAAWVRRHLVEV